MLSSYVVGCFYHISESLSRELIRHGRPIYTPLLFIDKKKSADRSNPMKIERNCSIPGTPRWNISLCISLCSHRSLAQSIEGFSVQKVLPRTFSHIAICSVGDRLIVIFLYDSHCERLVANDPFVRL